MTHLPSQNTQSVYALMNGAVIQTHMSNTQYMMLLNNKTQLEKPKLSWTSVSSGGLSYKSELLLRDANRLHSVWPEMSRFRTLHLVDLSNTTQ